MCQKRHTYFVTHHLRYVLTPYHSGVDELSYCAAFYVLRLLVLWVDCWWCGLSESPRKVGKSIFCSHTLLFYSRTLPLCSRRALISRYSLPTSNCGSVGCQKIINILFSHPTTLQSMSKNMLGSHCALYRLSEHPASSTTQHPQYVLTPYSSPRGSTCVKT